MVIIAPHASMILQKKILITIKEMIKHKISLSHAPTIRWIDNDKRHEIGSVTEPKNVVLWLSNDEHKKLHKCLQKRMGENNSVALALYDFTHSKVCSKHHKYKIWRTFENISYINYKYMGSSEC